MQSDFPETTSQISPPKTSRKNRDWIFDVLFVLVLLLGAYFRFTGLDWDEGTYLHPDERFLAIVESKIEPVGSLGEYWDTQNSTLNPNNKGEGFFVYGTLPIFFVRYVMEIFDATGYGDVARYGRPLAALFDLITIFVLYLTASRLYDRRVGFLAAAFSSFAVLQIQLSHFFTVDIFANVFIWLAIYLGSLIVTTKRKSIPQVVVEDEGDPEKVSLVKQIFTHPAAAWILLFGVITGAAVASKVSAYPVAFLLPAAVWAYYNAAADKRESFNLIVLLAISGFFAALTFRIFQPYAFSGPGFFGVLPNPHWLETIGRLQDLVQPSSGFPPSVQWFNRPFWFSAQNMGLWGIGLPMAIAAWAGVIWMGFRIFRGEWTRHILVWAWVVGHFLWQSAAPNPTMRYQLPIYPGMALMAAWSLTTLWDTLKAREFALRGLALAFTWLAGGFVFVFSLVYAAAFVNIYREPVTRLDASRWMYQNVPGAFTVRIRDGNQTLNQPLSFPNGFSIRPGNPYNTQFAPKISGSVQEIMVPHIESAAVSLDGASFFLTIIDEGEGGGILSSALTGLASADGANEAQRELVFNFIEPVQMEAFHTYRLLIELIAFNGELDICDPMSLFMLQPDGAGEIAIPAADNCQVSSDNPYSLTFTIETEGLLHNIRTSAPQNALPAGQSRTLTLEIWDIADNTPLGFSVERVELPAENVVFNLDKAVALEEGRSYDLRISFDSGEPIIISGAVLASETSWDDPLPMRVDGYDGFGGIYKGDNNLELYWEDNHDKVDRILRVLDAVDIIPISSSRQWASLTRLPEKWPLVDAYYRNLMGCPSDRTVEWCFNVAVPGMFEGNLGFELVETFQSDPTLGFFKINDQFSEEAFTVYDHPKVFIFLKTAAYDSARVHDLFNSVSLPVQGQAAQDLPVEIKPLLLTEARAEAQRNSGTWSDLYNINGFVNAYQPLTALIWYLTISIIGLAAYPVLRLVMPGLPDKGYPLSRTAGLLMLAYFVWLPGSLGLAVTRGLITIALAVITISGGAAFYFQRKEIVQEWRERKSYFFTIETFALALFVFVLIIRAANPDLWHPWKGGEKPMDFAYFNAVLKSVSFPPYDPWFAGGYINYYYYGYVFVGTVVKWLGIVPAVAYNLIIPTLFILVATGAYSIGWNLVQGLRPQFAEMEDPEEDILPAEGDEGSAAEPVPDEGSNSSYIAGIAAALGVALLGNLGSIRMIIQGYQRVGALPGAVLDETFILTRWLWGFRGFIEVLTTETDLPYALADWYWNPSRAIPAPGDIEPITEFPFFTFLYGDLHAHMIAIPIAIFALAWALSVILGKGKWKSVPIALLSFFIGGLTIGALRPTNTWDYPTYLLLGMIAVGYTAWRHTKPMLEERFAGLPSWALGLLLAVSGALWLGAISLYLYQPYTESYALGYTEINIWKQTHTPLSAYLTHWGLFLFAIVTWMLWETREWLAETPAVTGIRFLRSKLEFILAGLLIAAAGTVYLLYLEIETSLYLVPLLLWAGLLLFKRGISDQKRIVLFMTGTGLFLTLMVETIVLSGDIGRMNTVFKFYLQVWVLFGVSAAVCLGWLVPQLKRWDLVWSRAWRLVLAILVAFAGLYPLLGGFAKMKDRVNNDAPVTLDGMAYMPYATYFDEGRELFLVEDYRAIQWMQQNIPGTPVIVEGQVVEYRWGARYSIYTGLPTVLGWNWHQRQQRTGHDVEVWARDTGVDEFYSTTNVNIANQFIEKYAVEYIIVGQMEHAFYGGPGLDKFDTYEGLYWTEIYRDGETVIYQVIGGQG